MLNKLTFYSFLILIFSLGFMHPMLNMFKNRLPFTDFWFLLVFSLWIVSLLAKKNIFKFHQVFIFFALYLIVCLLSTLFSNNLNRSFIRFLGVIYLITLPLLTFNLINTKSEFRQTILAWLSGTIISLTIAVITFILFYYYPTHWLLAYTNYHFGAVPVGNYPRLASTFISASMFCNYLSVSLILLFIAEKFEWINNKMFYLLYFLILFCAIFTISSSIAGVFFPLGLWIYYQFRHKFPKFTKLSFAGSVFIAILFLLLNIFALQKYTNVPYSVKILGSNFYPSPRILVWTESFKTFVNNPLFGVGLGEKSCNVLFQNTDGSFSSLTDAHNVILSIASQSGMFGLIAILGIIIYFLTRKNNNFVSYLLWLAVLSSFIYQGLIGSFEDARHIWVLFGLLTASYTIFPQND